MEFQAVINLSQVVLSFDGVHLLDREEESSHTHSIVVKGPTTLTNHYVLCPVVYCVELSNLVAETYALEENSDLITSAGKLEIVL